ncbi:LysR family transcriptional regulator [Pseudoalteromonas arctica]|uniref:LysR family transcriptional regulator n=1 Tax=Pseudoalteromonas arctica TaxID=394751 RepID=UPI002494D5CA|nr:LysR family transcriptional regulator [Pseudoalteromonas arctica]
MFNYSLDDLRYFCAVLKLGSYKKASERLGVSLSTLSRKIRFLEQNLQLTLLNRDSRRITLTNIGELYYERYGKLFDDVACIEQELSDQKHKPEGLIRITAPIFLGKHFLSAIFCGFLKQYPEIKLDLRLTNTLIDLEEEGIDIAFRARNSTLDNWISRELKLTHNILCSHPKNLNRLLTHPKQLDEHDKIICLGLTPWELKNTLTNEKYSYQPNKQVRFEVDEIEMMRIAIESDVGISYIPDYVAHPLIEAGKLEQVLPEWQSEAQSFSMLYLNRSQIPKRVRLLIEYTLRYFLANTVV